MYICSCVCVCVGLLSLFPLPAKKTFIIKKITALVLSRLEKSKRNVSQKYKKKWKKRSATLPRHQQRLHFCMRATFSHLLYVCLECLCVCVCVCVATSCWLQQAPAMCCCWFYPLFVCVCVCLLLHSRFFIILFGVGHKNTPLCCCCKCIIQCLVNIIQ